MKELLKEWIPVFTPTLLAVIVVLIVLAVSVGHCDTFIADFADNPKASTTQTFAFQGALSYGVCRGAKQIFDDEPGGRQWDFVPIVGFNLLGFLIHSVYFGEGGKNANLAFQEQAFESAGSVIALF